MKEFSYQVVIVKGDFRTLIGKPTNDPAKAREVARSLKETHSRKVWIERDGKPLRGGKYGLDDLVYALRS